MSKGTGREELLPMLQRVSVRLGRLRAFETQAGEDDEASVTDDLDEQVVALARRLLSPVPPSLAAGAERLTVRVRCHRCKGTGVVSVTEVDPEVVTFYYGCAACREADEDGYITVDVPPEEADRLRALLALAPTEEKKAERDSDLIERLASLLEDVGKVKLSRTLWDEGVSVDVGDYSSEPFVLIGDALRKALDELPE